MSVQNLHRFFLQGDARKGRNKETKKKRKKEKKKSEEDTTQRLNGPRKWLQAIYFRKVRSKNHDQKSTRGV